MGWTYVRTRFGNLPIRVVTLVELNLTEHEWIDDDTLILAICDYMRSECLAQRLIEKVRKAVKSFNEARLDAYYAFLAKKQGVLPRKNDWA